MASLVCCWPGLLVQPRPHADERILSFDETITVNADGSLEVREVIRVRAEGTEHPPRHLPRLSDYLPRAATAGRSWWVSISSRRTRDGRTEPWRTENRGNGVRVYLGSAFVMVPHGEHTYELVYRTDRQMGYFADHDELYWNVTGNGWDFPIDRATARVVLPREIPRSRHQARGVHRAAGREGPGLHGADATTARRCSRPRGGLRARAKA